MNRTAIQPAQTLPLLPAPPGLSWRVVGAAVQGVSHERLGLPCQDAQGSLVRADGTLLIALADGAGSAQYSDQGAARAVEEALRALDAAFESRSPDQSENGERLLREVFSQAREAVLSLAEQEEGSRAAARDYAATLTCAVASLERLVVGQIGDGAVVGMDEDGQLFAITRLQRGEYANETHFLTQEDALDQLVIETVDRAVRGLAVMSDGLIRLALKMPAQEPHSPFFQPLFRFVESLPGDEGAGVAAAEQLQAFLRSDRVNSRTDDDKSLVLAFRNRSLSVQPAQGIAAHEKEPLQENAALDREAE